MTEEIIKLCKHHGPLPLALVSKEVNNSAKRGYTYRCRLCKREKDTRWRNENRESHNESAGAAKKEARRLYREGLSDLIPKANLWAMQDRINNPEKHREYKKTYKEKMGKEYTIREIARTRGITADKYKEILDSQRNLCFICKEPEKRKNRNGEIAQLCLDHNHITGEVRSFLCHDCNTMLGKFDKSIERMQSAIKYLNKHGGICLK